MSTPTGPSNGRHQHNSLLTLKAAIERINAVAEDINHEDYLYQ